MYFKSQLLIIKGPEQYLRREQYLSRELYELAFIRLTHIFFLETLIPLCEMSVLCIDGPKPWTKPSNHLFKMAVPCWPELMILIPLRDKSARQNGDFWNKHIFQNACFTSILLFFLYMGDINAFATENRDFSSQKRDGFHPWN